jgi:hypothetical protein
MSFHNNFVEIKNGAEETPVLLVKETVNFREKSIAHLIIHWKSTKINYEKMDH